MSKVVKKIGRGIGKLFKGVKKVVSKAWKAIKKSKLLKTIAVAAAVYFTGGAALGAIGGASGGVSGMLAGAKAGLSSAWGGVTGAASAVSGGNFAAAGSKLAGGITGAHGAGATAAGKLAGIAAETTGTAATASANPAIAGGAQSGSKIANMQWGMNGGQSTMGGLEGGGVLSSGTQNVATKLAADGAAATEASGGILGFAKANPMATALIAQPVIGGISGYAQAKQAEEEERKRIDRINGNYGRIDYDNVYIPYSQRVQEGRQI